MPNKWFQEYNDPKIYRNLKIGFASLVILGVLIAFIVSPPLRHSIGIGSNHSVENPPAKVYPHHHAKNQPGNHERHRDHQHSSHQKRVEGHAQPSEGHHTQTKPKGSEGAIKIHHPNGHSPGSGGGKPTPSAPEPSAPPPSHPTEDNLGGGNSGQAEGSDNGKGRPETPPTAEGHGKAEVELEVPNVTTLPPVEETVHGVNNTVNGATSAVEGKVDELETPVQVEVP